MPSAQKAAISFGLVHIPVELFVATKENDISFNQLTRDEHKRVRYRKTDGEREVQNADIIKGYQYEKDKYVIISDEDLQKIKTPKDDAIQILQFVDQAAIPSVYYNRAYYVLSGRGGEKAFELLRMAMQNEGKVAIGKTVIGTKETMLVLIPTEDGILMQTLYFNDEVREIPRESAHPAIDPKELDMAVRLIDNMAGQFDPSDYKDEYQSRLRLMIEDKIAGKEIKTPRKEKESNVVSLMDALQKSLDQKPPKSRRKTASK